MTQLTENLFAVEVPEGASNFKIKPHYVRNHIEERDEIKLIWDSTQITHNWLILPAGNWQFICTTREATNGNAMGIVKSHYSRSASYNPVLGHYQTSGSSTTFMDYMNGHCTFDSPLDSLRSLLASKGLDVNKNYALLKKG